ncbi:MAG TPA: TPM domain-containing protein [Thermoanaerobaculia bacterium]|nr:TPM domain-containing protein [Thermoanaerobaculia bacterium]
MRKLLLLFVFVTIPAIAAIPLPEKPAKYVTDVANLLDDARENALNEKLAQYERETSNQILIYVDRKVPEGTTLEEMGAEAIRTWGVGQEKKDNGAILFLFVDDRQSRIEAGYGLEGTLTDARSKRILVELRPLLRDANYIGAIELGADRIIATIKDPTATPPLEASTVAERESEPFPLRWLFVALIFFGTILIYGFIRAVRAATRGGALSGGGSSSSSTWSSPSDSWSSSSSSSDSSSSSSDSSSSFSGGGGSGGGGGASDNW